MRTTISNMVGVLPPHLFDVTVSTVGESLAQLMFSVIMTGASPAWPRNFFTLALAATDLSRTSCCLSHI